MGRRVGAVIIAAVAFFSACTVQRTPAPPLQGPSELALSLAIFANPDVISQDGASQSLIVVQVRDANGQPASNVPFRAEITVAGVASDFGRLSARTLVTGTDGRATVTYTAPPPPLVSVDANTRVSIRITPTGTNFADDQPRSVDIRLVPPGVIIGSGTGPTAAFTFTPAAPAAFTNVIFDASTSKPPANGVIAAFSWNFGDGGTATGLSVTHQFAKANSYPVVLTVTDSNGISASSTQTVTVGQGNLPTASFSFSPNQPTVLQNIFFNGSASTPGTGRTIVRYDWDFGSGSPRSGVTVTKSYDVAGTFAVVLTVTDDVGQQARQTQNITVSQPSGSPSGLTANFTVSPTSPAANTTVTFNASDSTFQPGFPIVSFDWDFGDGGFAPGQTSPIVTHVYTASGTYNARLTVRDSLGRLATRANTVTVSGSGPVPTANFTVSPASPTAGVLVTFNAGDSTFQPGFPIVAYDWDFGDGVLAPGQTNPIVTHVYAAAGTYNARLTVRDLLGRTATKTSTVTVTGSLSNPTANFTLSPSPAKAGMEVSFDASSSTAAAGSSIVRYQWDFGDGTQLFSTTAPTVGHTYPTKGTFVITLTVTDSAGRSGATSKTLVVQ